MSTITRGIDARMCLHGLRPRVFRLPPRGVLRAVSAAQTDSPLDSTRRRVDRSESLAVVSARRATAGSTCRFSLRGFSCDGPARAIPAHNSVRIRPRTAVGSTGEPEAAGAAPQADSTCASTAARAVRADLRSGGCGGALRTGCRSDRPARRGRVAGGAGARARRRFRGGAGATLSSGCYTTPPESSRTAGGVPGRQGRASCFNRLPRLPIRIRIGRPS